MKGQDIKKRILATIVEFYEIEGRDTVKVPVSEFKDISGDKVAIYLERLEQDGIIELVNIKALKSDIRSQMDKLAFNVNHIFIKVTKKFKQDIAKKSIPDEYIDDSEIIYKITLRGRKLYINNFLLASPRFDSENDIFAEYILKNPNKKITIKDFEKYTNSKMKKKFERIVLDLGFKGILKKLFFPDISIRAVKFINPVTRKKLKELSISYLTPSDLPVKNRKK